MPMLRSTLFLRAVAIAEPLSAAPPTMARKMMPMNVSDMPRDFPVPSAAPTSISLIQAARTEPATSVMTALPTLQRSPSVWCCSAPPTLLNRSVCSGLSQQAAGVMPNDAFDDKIRDEAADLPESDDPDGRSAGD